MRDYSVKIEHLKPITGYLKYCRKVNENLRTGEEKDFSYGLLSGSLGAIGLMAWNGLLLFTGLAAINGLEKILQ